jgi:LysM repeat protein
VWRFLATLGVFVAIAGATPAPASDVPARLSIDALSGSVTSVLVPTQGTLQCDDETRGTGFLRHAAGPACAVVRRGVLVDIARRHRSARLCTDDYGGPQRAHVKGTVRSRRVDVTITRDDGCGIDEWRRLQALLGDPERRGAIPRRRRPAATTATSPPATYVVQRGDTLTAIAKQFNTSVAAIVTTNQLTDADELAPGQLLEMPPPTAVRIEAKLVDGQPASGFGLVLVGAAPSEVVTFVITLPDGSTHTGSPHVASGYGVVASTYHDAVGSGTYTVTATGERGTNAQVRFHLDEPA